MSKTKYGIESPSKITFEIYGESPSKISFESYGVKYTWETNHSDLTLDEVLEAFYKLLIAHGFDAEGVLKCMKYYAEEELEIMESCKENVEEPQHEEEDLSIRHKFVRPNE